MGAKCSGGYREVVEAVAGQASGSFQILEPAGQWGEYLVITEIELVVEEI